MFLTALSCYTTANLTSFAAVHDSFYSHACDYDTLQRVLKEEFVSLYSQPILENLRQELLERYRGFRVPLHRFPSTSWARRSHSSFESKNKLNVFRGKIPLSILKKKSHSNSLKISPEHWREISIPPVPICGDLNISEIHSSEYFFN